MFLVKSIKPRLVFNVKVLTGELKSELRNQGQIAKREFEKVVSTWSPRATFRVDWHERPNQAIVQVITNDKRFLWLDKGTRIRWAVMSRDFSPKTTYRTIGARSGGGRVVIRGRQAMQQRNIKPRRGIKAREFSKEILKRRKPSFYKAMREAIARGKRKSR